MSCFGAKLDLLSLGKQRAVSVEHSANAAAVYDTLTEERSGQCLLRHAPVRLQSRVKKSCIKKYTAVSWGSSMPQQVQQRLLWLMQGRHGPHLRGTGQIKLFQVDHPEAGPINTALFQSCLHAYHCRRGARNLSSWDRGTIMLRTAIVTWGQLLPGFHPAGAALSIRSKDQTSGCHHQRTQQLPARAAILRIASDQHPVARASLQNLSHFPLFTSQSTARN